MELDERLTKDQIRAAKNAAKEPYYAEEPDWLIYKEREKQPWLNKDRGVFQETDKYSVNKAPSVFESGTVFHAGGIEVQETVQRREESELKTEDVMASQTEKTVSRRNSSTRARRIIGI